MTNGTRQATGDGRGATGDGRGATGDGRGEADAPTPVIGKSGGFRRTLSFGLACLVYYATEVFCRRNFGLGNDPLGKTFGQMAGAARSAKQNIVEGSSRRRRGGRAARTGSSPSTRRRRRR